MHGIPARAFSFTDNGGAQQLLTGGALLLGWWLKETTGSAPAELVVTDGTAPDALVVADVDLLTSESTREWFGPAGIELRQGAVVTPATGSVNGALYLVPGERYDEYLLALGLKPIWSGRS